MLIPRPELQFSLGRDRSEINDGRLPAPPTTQPSRLACVANGRIGGQLPPSGNKNAAWLVAEDAALLRRGLAPVPALPNTDWRRERELDLLIALAQALNMSWVSNLGVAWFSNDRGTPIAPIPRAASFAFYWLSDRDQPQSIRGDFPVPLLRVLIRQLSHVVPRAHVELEIKDRNCAP
jgi:hypothetical protein